MNIVYDGNSSKGFVQLTSASIVLRKTRLAAMIDGASDFVTNLYNNAQEKTLPIVLIRSASLLRRTNTVNTFFQACAGLVFDRKQAAQFMKVVYKPVDKGQDTFLQLVCAPQFGVITGTGSLAADPSDGSRGR